jgi:hypothetical protein
MGDTIRIPVGTQRTIPPAGTTRQARSGEARCCGGGKQVRPAGMAGEVW